MTIIYLENDRLGSRSDHWWLEELKENPKDYPSMHSNEDKKVIYYYIFCKEIRQWMIDNKIKYRLKYISNRSSEIKFFKESDAMLFKLTWM